MPLWRFQPITPADDDRWLDHPRYADVVVRADTAGEAVIVATARLRAHDEIAGNETDSDRTGLEDEKLYRLQRVDPDAIGLAASEAQGGPTVLRAVRG